MVFICGFMFLVSTSLFRWTTVVCLWQQKDIWPDSAHLTSKGTFDVKIFLQQFSSLLKLKCKGITFIYSVTRHILLLQRRRVSKADEAYSSGRSPSPHQRTVTCSHTAIHRLLLIYRPRRDRRLSGLVSGPMADSLPTKWSPVRERTPVKE